MKKLLLVLLIIVLSSCSYKTYQSYSISKDINKELLETFGREHDSIYLLKE